jgi:glycosyltransferase involved in cell wall biosynthesis
VPVAASGPATPARDIDALAYAGDPVKRRLELILDAWTRARRDGETLVVTGTERPNAPPGVRFTGRLEPEAYRALVRRARVFVAAPRREDFGIAPLEALADGCQLVTTPSPGPYPALDDPRAGYAAHATRLLAPFSHAAVDRTVAECVLPRLLTR